MNHLNNDVLELQRFLRTAKFSLQQLMSYTDETGNEALGEAVGWSEAVG